MQTLEEMSRDAAGEIINHPANDDGCIPTFNDTAEIIARRVRDWHNARLEELAWKMKTQASNDGATTGYTATAYEHAARLIREAKEQ